MTSEFDLIARYFTRPAPEDTLGVGDDCALFPVPPGMQIATSKDLLIQGRHFYPDVDPESLGHKALAVNLSDLAAMGAKPLGCLLGLALPELNESWLGAFARGFHALAEAHGCALLGGDTTRGVQDLTISVTVFGAVDAQTALRRDRARVGDHIWVSGALGAADVAYRLLDRQLPPDDSRLAATRRALEWPAPRVALGQALAGLAHAGIDISDGLLQDLGHVLTSSGVGARLRFDAIPVAPALSGLDQETVARAVLGGGDAYELCFTAAAGDEDRIRQAGARTGVPVTRIGRITEQTGLQVLGHGGCPMPVLSRGYDHFSGS